VRGGGFRGLYLYEIGALNGVAQFVIFDLLGLNFPILLFRCACRYYP
jgi:hypothetical protein